MAVLNYFNVGALMEVINISMLVFLFSVAASAACNVPGAAYCEEDTMDSYETNRLILALLGRVMPLDRYQDGPSAYDYNYRGRDPRGKPCTVATEMGERFELLIQDLAIHGYPTYRILADAEPTDDFPYDSKWTNLRLRMRMPSSLVYTIEIDVHNESSKPHFVQVSIFKDERLKSSCRLPELPNDLINFIAK